MRKIALTTLIASALAQPASARLNCDISEYHPTPRKYNNQSIGCWVDGERINWSTTKWGSKERYVRNIQTKEVNRHLPMVVFEVRDAATRNPLRGTTVTLTPLEDDLATPYELAHRINEELSARTIQDFDCNVGNTYVCLDGKHLLFTYRKPSRAGDPNASVVERHALEGYRTPDGWYEPNFRVRMPRDVEYSVEVEQSNGNYKAILDFDGETITPGETTPGGRPISSYIIWMEGAGSEKNSRVESRTRR